MKVSDILVFMGIEFTVRGDCDYSESIELQKLNADWPKGMPTNEAFHASAPLCKKELEKRVKTAEKYMSYPNHTDWLLAITKQIELISNGNEVCDEFLQLKTNLDSIEKKYRR